MIQSAPLAVTLADYSGSDRHVAMYFWTSTDKDADAFTCPESEVERVIRFGMKAKPAAHATPFGHSVVTVHIDGIDLATGEQLLRHRTGNFSKKSHRYVNAAPAFYLPAAEDVRGQTGRPGAYTFSPLDDRHAASAIETIRQGYEHQYQRYRHLVDDVGVAPELARMVLPVGLQTRMYMTLSLRNWLNVFVQRSDEHAQLEVRRVSEQIEPILDGLYPITMRLWREYGRRIV